MPMAVGLPALPPPIFLSDSDGLDPNLILADMVTAFQTAAKRTLQPAQVERLLINLYAYREALMRNAIQYTGQQNLLAFAAFPMLDYLGELLSVTRLPAQSASTTLQFNLVNTLSISYIIPKGTTIGTTDGQFLFATSSDVSIPPGATAGTVLANATRAGSDADGYLPGQINVQLSPSALIGSVANTTVSGGGSAPETDEHLRTRIQAAPNRFSVAGPEGSYRYFTLSADTSIADAQIVSPGPGKVNVYVLTGPVSLQPAQSPNLAAVASSELLEKVTSELSADNVRPLTDSVSALAITEVDYQIAGAITLYADTDPASIMEAANTAAQQYAIALASRIQRDIVPSQIIEILSVPGVYQVSLTEPAYTQLQPGEWANCVAISLTQTVVSQRI
jgi:phage-related baseplate assembly protein